MGGGGITGELITGKGCIGELVTGKGGIGELSQVMEALGNFYR